MVFVGEQEIIQEFIQNMEEDERDAIRCLALKLKEQVGRDDLYGVLPELAWLCFDFAHLLHQGFVGLDAIRIIGEEENMMEMGSEKPFQLVKRPAGEIDSVGKDVSGQMDTEYSDNGWMVPRIEFASIE